VADRRAPAGPQPPGVSAGTLALRDELAQRGMRPVAALPAGPYELAVARGRDAVWLLVRRPGRGGLALRAAACAGGSVRVRKRPRRAGEALRLEAASLAGTHEIALRLIEDAVPLVRVSVTFTPAAPLLVSFVPRDLYPLGAGDDPLAAEGTVEAAQRGLNTGALFFRMTRPAFGSVLYLQDLTRLNPYFAATGTTPDGAVGGIWPEIGYLLPTPPQRGEPAAEPLPAGRPVALSDALLALHGESEGDERDMARRYLVLLGTALRQVEQPRTEYRDWVGRAERSLADLAGSRKASVHHYGHRYLHPYTDA
jgi:hypothetical protein